VIHRKYICGVSLKFVHHDRMERPFSPPLIVVETTVLSIGR
jgi:hypothetical protein